MSRREPSNRRASGAVLHRMSELVMMIGVPGAGKSTWCRAALGMTHVVLGRDLLRTAHRERVLFFACLSVGASLVVDNTNLRRRGRARFLEPARAAGYRVVAVFCQATAALAMARNAQRKGRARVPELAISGALAELEPPTLEEGFDRIETIVGGELDG